MAFLIMIYNEISFLSDHSYVSQTSFLSVKLILLEVITIEYKQRGTLVEIKNVRVS